MGRIKKQIKMCEDFKDIAPFEDSEFHEKMAALVKEPGFEHAVRWVMPDVDYPEFVKGLLSISNKKDFQHNIMASFLEMLVAKTTAGISIDGLENCSRGTNYTFITNHRDIVLDASLLNLCFLKHKMPTTEVAIGSNLLIYDWIDELVRLNKSFIVKRNLKKLEALDAARHLSGYIHYAINCKHESIWIAQREGRAKDSDDMTQEGLIKMIGLAGGGSFLENIKSANLVPVAISYEFDPNDYLKAREFLLRRDNPDYKKTQRDDLFSMETGLLQYKGRIHMSVRKCVNHCLGDVAETSCKGEVAEQVCGIIDNAIHSGYRLYPINYIACDKLLGSGKFADRYTGEDVDKVEEYIERQLSKVEIENPTEEGKAYMRQMMLKMYANPVKNKLLATAER